MLKSIFQFLFIDELINLINFLIILNWLNITISYHQACPFQQIRFQRHGYSCLSIVNINCNNNGLSIILKMIACASNRATIRNCGQNNQSLFHSKFTDFLIGHQFDLFESHFNVLKCVRSELFDLRMLL